MDFFSNLMESTEGCNAINAGKGLATNANANGNRNTMASRVKCLPAGRRRMTRTFKIEDSANTWRTTALVG